MAITRDNLVTQATTSSSTSYTISSYTVNTGSNRVLTVFAHVRIGSTSDFTCTATWNGLAMTEAITNTGTGTSRRWRTYIWYYIAPAVTSANIVISTDGTTAVSWVAGAVTLQGAKQTSPVGTTGTSTSATAAITFNSVTAGSIILTAHTSDSAGPVDWAFTTSTELYDVNQGDTTAEIGGAAGYYDVVSSGNVTLTATKTGTGQGAISAGAEFLAAATVHSVRLIRPRSRLVNNVGGVLAYAI